MIHAHIYDYMSTAKVEFRDFLYEHEHEIKKAMWLSGDCIAILKNGDEHHFLTEAIYYRWSRGRAYMIDNKLFHSGYPIARGE